MATLSNSPLLVARVALKAAERALPQWMSPFSRHDGATFPQLFACLTLRAFWKTSLRGCEAQLRDAEPVQRALGLRRVPDHSALGRAHQALAERHLERLTQETVRLALSAGALAPGPGGGATLLPDATGLTRSRASHFAQHSQSSYARRKRAKKKRHRPRKPPRSAWRYPKWAVAIDADSLFILAQLAYRGPCGDVQDFGPLLLDAHALRPSGRVIADSGYDSTGNVLLAERGLGMHAVVRVRNHCHGHPESIDCARRRALYRNLPRSEFCRRNPVECAFSANKRRFGDLTPSRTERGRFKDTLLRGVLHNCALLMT